MKAYITVIDDNGEVLCMDKVLAPFKEEIIITKPYLRPIKESRFNFVITQLADCQVGDYLNLEIKLEQGLLDKIKSESEMSDENSN